jgi:hypothetical protein
MRALGRKAREGFTILSTGMAQITALPTQRGESEELS